MERIFQTDPYYRDRVDFFYLPIDFSNKCNLGYAFINLTSTEAAEKFSRDFQGFRLPGLETISNFLNFKK